MQKYIYRLLILSLYASSLYSAYSPEQHHNQTVSDAQKQKYNQRLKGPGRPIPQQPKIFTFSEYAQQQSQIYSEQRFADKPEGQRTITYAQEQWGNHLKLREKEKSLMRQQKEVGEELQARRQELYKEAQARAVATQEQAPGCEQLQRKALQQEQLRQNQLVENQLRQKQRIAQLAYKQEQFNKQILARLEQYQEEQDYNARFGSSASASSESSESESPEPRATGGIMAALERFHDRVKTPSRKVSLYNIRDENGSQSGESNAQKNEHDEYAAMPENPYKLNKKQQEPAEQLLDFSAIAIDAPYYQLPEHDDNTSLQSKQSAFECCCKQQ